MKLKSLSFKVYLYTIPSKTLNQFDLLIFNFQLSTFNFQFNKSVLFRFDKVCRWL